MGGAGVNTHWAQFPAEEPPVLSVVFAGGKLAWVHVLAVALLTPPGRSVCPQEGHRGIWWDIA